MQLSRVGFRRTSSQAHRSFQLGRAGFCSGNDAKVLIQKLLQKASDSKTFSSHVIQGAVVTEASKETGYVEVKIPVSFEMSNMINSMHGGAIATVVDLITTASLVTKDKNQRWGVSAELSCSYLKAVTVGETIVVKSRVDKLGKSLGFTQCEIFDEAGNLLATGKHTKFMDLPVTVKLQEG